MMYAEPKCHCGVHAAAWQSYTSRQGEHTPAFALWPSRRYLAAKVEFLASRVLPGSRRTLTIQDLAGSVWQAGSEAHAVRLGRPGALSKVPQRLKARGRLDVYGGNEVPSCSCLRGQCPAMGKYRGLRYADGKTVCSG